MTQALSQYEALWRSQRTRRRTVRIPRGLDAVAGRWWMRASHAQRGVRRWQDLAQRAVTLDSAYGAMSDTELDAVLASLREDFARGRSGETRLIDAMAALRETAWRIKQQKPYPVQIMAAFALYHGQVVEMKTGEGKTLTAVLAAVPLAWSRPRVHIVTANDYLAERDAATMAPLYARAGVTCGSLLPTQTPAERMAAHRRQVMYTTQKELVGDWLRDQVCMAEMHDAMTERLSRSDGGFGASVMVPGLHAVIVDEADAVLIDGAVTPLVISSARQTSDTPEVYRRAGELARDMKESRDFEIDAAAMSVRLTDRGRRRLARLVKHDDQGVLRGPRRRRELVEQALAALHCYHRARQYEIVEDRVILVDEYTGRFMQDRHWQRGIHQAVEAKEGLEITGEGRSLASLSFQRFFRMYPFLAGMTGTATGSHAEFERVYGVPVRVIPTNRPQRRQTWPTRIYRTAEARWSAVVESVSRLHGEGRPVLIGTRSIEASQHLSELLGKRGLKHEVLNAIHHEQEARIIAGAGEAGTITVATNMAGRGTDIVLGMGVAERGGLHVMLTELHAASRVDRQFIGRCARQGDPGSSQMFASLEDELLARHGSTLVKYFGRLYAGGDNRPAGRWSGVLLKMAQRHAEARASRQRQALLERDDWLDQALPLR